MKKETMQSIGTVLSILAGIFLVANLISQSQEKQCMAIVDNLTSQKDVAKFSYSLVSDNYMTLLIAHMIKEPSIINITNDTIAIGSYENRSYVLNNRWNLTLDYMRQVAVLENQIIEKKIECHNISQNSNYFLYAAIICNLVALVFSGMFIIASTKKKSTTSYDCKS